MRTVLFTDWTSAAVSGIANRQERLAKLLPDFGWRSIFALTSGTPSHNAETYRASHPDLETILLDGSGGTADGRRFSIRRAIDRVRPDVVIPGAVLDTFEVMRERKTEKNAPRLVYGLLGMADHMLGAVRHFGPIMDHGYGVSRLMTRLLPLISGLPEYRVDYVPTGVFPAPFRNEGSIDGRLNLGYVGRLDVDKRALDLIPLCEQLEKAGVDFHLSIVGAGSLEGDLRRRAARWIESGVVEFSSPMTSTKLHEEIYPSLDALLLFSSAEGFPNVVLEAMSHGVVPVIAAFRGVSLEELIRSGTNCFVFPVGDVASAAGAIKQLADSRELRLTTGERARQDVHEQRSVRKMAESFSRMLIRSVEEPPRLGVVSPPADLSRSRLRKVLGARAAERTRRLFGRRSPYPDDREWPLVFRWNGPEVVEVREILESQLPKLERPVSASPGTSRSRARGRTTFDSNLVSVVMPMFNSSGYVQEAVESLLSQEGVDLEVVVVDDGSSDGSREIVESLATRDGRVQIVRQERGGTAAALIRGVEMARGAFLARLDADDVALPGRLKTQLRTFEADPSLALLGGGVVVVDASGREKARWEYPTGNEDIQNALMDQNCFAHPSVMMRRSAFEEAGGYRPIPYSQDYDLWLRIAEHHTLANLPQPLIRYRVHSDQVSATKLVDQALSSFGVLAASRLRRAGFKDPLEASPEITWDRMLSWGVSVDELNELVLLAYTTRAALALRMGDAGASRRLLEQFFRTLDANRRRGQRYADAVCVLTRAHFEEGSVMKALKVGTGGLVSSGIGWRSALRRAFRVLLGDSARTRLGEVAV